MGVKRKTGMLGISTTPQKPQDSLIDRGTDIFNEI